MFLSSTTTTETRVKQNRAIKLSATHKEKEIAELSCGGQARVERSAASNPLPLPPTWHHATGNLQPFPARHIVSNQPVHLSRSQGQHEQAFVAKASHPNVLSVKLQAPYVWHSVNLLP